MSDRLIVPSGMSRRHFLGHLATTALALPAMQFFGALEANAQQLRKQQQELHPALDGRRPEPHGHLGPEARQREERRPVQADRDLGPRRDQISEHLPTVAKQMKHLSIIRSLDSKEGNHDRGTYMMHTGLRPEPDRRASRASARSARTSWARQLENFDLPHCISINSPGHGRGLPGMAHSPFVVQNPNAADRQPPAARGSRRRCGWAAGCRCSAWSRTTSSPAARGQAARRPQGRLRQDGPDDELAATPGPSSSTTSPPRSATPTAGARSARAA